MKITIIINDKEYISQEIRDEEITSEYGKVWGKELFKRLKDLISKYENL